MRTKLAAMALAAWGLAAGPAAAAPWRAEFDAYLGGFRLARIGIAVDRGARTYEADATVETTGLAWLFAPSSGRAKASGAIEGAAVVPARFAAEGVFGDAPQRVEMRYGAGPAPELTADPPLRERSYDPAPETLAGALDPLNAAVAALAMAGDAPCGRSLPVFDSRRRYDLRLGPPATEGDLIRCEGRYVRVSGFKAKHMAWPDHPFTTWWRATATGAEFVRAAAPTRFGHATLIRR